MKSLISMKWVSIALAFLTISLGAQAQVNRNVSEYNLQGDLGLKGYDPVSYFAEGGSQPAKGDSAISYNHRGVTYRFSSVENREIFKVMPERYEPTYGGYCAWAMAASGSKVNIDPLLYTLDGNRIHFFIAPGTKRSFDRNVSRFAARADNNWRNLTGEEPRL